MLLFILALRVVLSPLSNVYQKKLAEKGAHPFFIVALTYAVIALLFLPFAFIAGRPLAPGFWTTIILASVVDAVGNVLLVKSLETTELSVFGPINSFKPAIALLLGLVLLQEVPTSRAVIGVGTIIAGSILLTLKKEKAATDYRGLLFRVSGIVCSSVGAVLIKKAINFSNPEISMLLWTVFALPLFGFIIAVFYRSRLAANKRLLKENSKTYLLLFATYGAMQYVTLLSFNITFVGYSLAIFQLSSLLSIFLGYRYFNEKGAFLKLFSALIMIAGALLIILP
jgi:drug/metabolite transporter (DMT)-like permease